MYQSVTRPDELPVPVNIIPRVTCPIHGQNKYFRYSNVLYSPSMRLEYSSPQQRDSYVTPHQCDSCVTGDLLIGALVSVRQDDIDSECGELVTPENLWKAEAIRFAVDKINQDPTILPGITLGFVMLDTCKASLGYLINVAYFIPDEETLLPNQMHGTCRDGLSHFPVISVITPGFSSVAVMIAPVMGIANIPIFSSLATSDELSDKGRYEYFMRVVAPDQFQAKVIIDILQHFNWTYFSLIYSEGSYGQNGAKFIEKEAKDRGLCIAVSEIVYSIGARDNLKGIIRHLKDNKKARAVVLFLETKETNMFWSLLDEDTIGRYMWIGGDSVSYSDFGASSDGAFAIFFKDGSTEEFDNYTHSLTPYNHPDDYWLHLAWQNHFNCTWENTTCELPNCNNLKSCKEFENETILGGVLGKGKYGSVPMNLDIVKTIGLGLDSMIREKCPHVFNDTSHLYDCFSVGEEFLEYLKDVHFNGSFGEIRFTEAGDNMANYLVKQFSVDEGLVEIGEWKQDTGFVTFDETRINWSPFPLSEAEILDQIPHSVCSYQCPARYYFIQKEVDCCWDCRQCRDNEIIINGTSCERCPLNTWPDEEMATVCETIKATYMSMQDAIGLVLGVINCVGIVLALIITLFMIKNRNKKIIKASSRELMSMILIGIFLAFITVFIIVSKPNDAMCFFAQFGFMVSVALVYGPLLVKTTRVYRIFEAGKRGHKQLILISNRAQMFLSIALITMQVNIMWNRFFCEHVYKYRHFFSLLGCVNVWPIEQ